MLLSKQTALSWENLYADPDFVKALHGLIKVFNKKNLLLNREADKPILNKRAFLENLRQVCLQETCAAVDEQQSLLVVCNKAAIHVKQALQAVVGTIHEECVMGLLKPGGYALLIKGIMQDKDALGIAHKILGGLPSETNIGMIRFTAHNAIPEELLKKAYRASYHIHGQGRVRVYREEDDVRIEEDRRIRKIVGAAKKNDKFIFHVQAKFDRTGKKIVGFELLLRICGSEELVPPKFIPYLDRETLMKITYAGIRKAAEISKKIYDERNTKITGAVNIPPLFLEDAEFVQEVHDIFYRVNAPERCVELEILEDSFNSDKEEDIIANLKLLKKTFIISIDDFGSGQSGLGRLRKISMIVDRAKIDGSFLEDKDEQSRNFLSDIVGLISRWNMRVTAEKVADLSDLEYFDKKEFDGVELQGHALSRAVQELDFYQLIEKMGTIDSETYANIPV